MKKVVVIAGQSGREIVQEFQRVGYSVLLICGKTGEAGSDIANDLLVIDLSETEATLSAIENYSRLVFFGTGHNLAIDLAKLCESKGFTINFDPNIANLFKNKLKTHLFVRELGYQSPLLQIIEDDFDQFIPESLPVVLKSEQDTYKTEAVSSLADFHRIKAAMLATGSRVLVERFIDGFEVTLPIIADKNSVKARPEALDMEGINEKAVSILKGFDLNREKNKAGSIAAVVTPDVKRKIVDATETIVSKSGFYGYPRFDIMVDGNDFYILEVNSIMVTAVGGTHYPWGDVGLNPARDMVDLFLNNLN